MGCSGSHPVAQPTEPLDAVGPSSNRLAAAGQRDKQQAGAGKSTAATGAGAAAGAGAGGPGIQRVKTLQRNGGGIGGGGGGGGGLAITTSSDSAPNSPPPSVTAAKSLPRKSSAAGAGAGAAASIPCDVDESHVATLRCEECEEHFCLACDTAFHRKKNAKHTRTPLPGASALALPVPLAITRTPSSSRPSSRPASPHHGDNSSGGGGGGGGREKGSSSAAPSAASSPAPLRAPSHLAPLRKDGSPAAASGSLSPFAPLPSAGSGGGTPKQQPLMRTRTVTVASLNPNGASASAAGGSSAGGGKQPSPPNSKRASLVGEQKESGGSALSPTKGGATKRMPTFQRSTTMRIGETKRAVASDDEKVIHAVPVEKLRALGGAQLELIWAQYDSDGNGVLDRKELALLASDCIARTLSMMEDEIRKQNPGISESQLKNAIEKERAFILPGKGKKEEAHQQMVKHLVRKLDVNGDGSVTKAELMMQWNSFSAGLFQVREQEALECVIM